MVEALIISASTFAALAAIIAEHKLAALRERQR
jgi:hypothetical protein